MGFFKRLFKRKKGGTFFGNLLRKASSTVTGGILGSGVGLANWEAKQHAHDQAAQMQAQIRAQQAQLAQASAVNRAKNAVMTSDAAAPLTNAGAKAWFGRLTKNPLFPVLFLIAVFFLMRRRPLISANSKIR